MELDNDDCFTNFVKCMWSQRLLIICSPFLFLKGEGFRNALVFLVCGVKNAVVGRPVECLHGFYSRKVFTGVRVGG